MTGGRGAAPTPRRQMLLQVGRFFGVPLYFAPSWILIATFVTIFYAPVVKTLVPGLPSGQATLTAAGFAVGLALCVLAHELGHTAVSLAMGRPVRRVVIFLLGGISEIEGEVDRARDEFFIALAGPLVSALIAGLAAGATAFTHHGTIAGAVLDLLLWSNVIVAAFNLLPGLPLDGGRVLRAAIWAGTRSSESGTRIAAWVGRVVAVAVAVAGVALATQSYGFAGSLVDLLVALFIWNGANSALVAARTSRRIKQLRLADLLRPGLMVHADVSVAEALRRTRESRARGIVVLDSSDRPQAIVEERRVRAVPIDQQPWTQIGTVARSLEPGLVLQDSLDGDALVDAIRATPAGEYLVVDATGAPAGILSSADLASAVTGGRG